MIANTDLWLGNHEPFESPQTGAGDSTVTLCQAPLHSTLLHLEVKSGSRKLQHVSDETHALLSILLLVW